MYWLINQNNSGYTDCEKHNNLYILNFCYGSYLDNTEHTLVNGFLKSMSESRLLHVVNSKMSPTIVFLLYVGKMIIKNKDIFKWYTKNTDNEGDPTKMRHAHKRCIHGINMKIFFYTRDKFHMVRNTEQRSFILFACSRDYTLFFDSRYLYRF